MKNKVFLLLALTLLVVLVMCLGVSAAETVTDDATDTLTLGACTINGVDASKIPSPTVGLVYTLDSTTKTASVSGRGSFTGGNLVFPSTVTYGGKTYNVTRIENYLFNNGNGTRLSYSIYVPDSITTIVGGNGRGTFGNSNLDKVYIGSGLTVIDTETFSGSRGLSVFVCKSKPTKIGKYAFNGMSAGSNGISEYELDLSSVVRFEEVAFNGATFLRELTLGENVEYIGSQAFLNCSNMNGDIIIPQDCVVSYRCFNGTNLDRVIIRVKEGETFNAPVEMFSGAYGNLTVIFDGPALADNYFFSGRSADYKTHVHFQTYSQIEAFVKSVSEKAGNDRISGAIFYSCDEGEYYTASSAGVITKQGELDAHVYTEEPVHYEKDCSRYERYAYTCYCCGDEQIESQGTELGEHVCEIITKEANCQSMGYIQYVCTVCDYEETVHFYDKSSHSATVIEYVKKDYATLVATYKCEHCNTIVKVEDVSLVNKCYIAGYGQELFDASMTYVSVDEYGVATPSGASFNNAVIYFPSCVKIGENIVEVKTVQGFKALSIKSIYIPDSVTRIAGGSGTGCFGDISTLKNIVVGSGVSELEQEVFCMGNGATLDEFIFKGTITSMKFKCLNAVKASSTSIPYEFNTYLSYVGMQVNLDGNIIRTATIAKGCNLSEKFAFNDANGLTTVYIEGGDTPETALDLGQEFTSNTATTAYYIKGYVTVSGQALLSGLGDTRIYMQNTTAIDLLASAIISQSYKDRMKKATFFDCATETAWYVDQSGTRTKHSSVQFAHGGIYETVAPSCDKNGTSIEKCYICGDTVASTELEKLEHSFDGGTITKMPTTTEKGTIVYTCFGCGDSFEKEILVALGTHKEAIKVYYTNGFDNKGTSIKTCSHCDYTQTIELDAIFVLLGYSIKQDKSAITCGYEINLEALSYYENNVGKLEFGVILTNASDVSTKGLLDESYNLVSGVRGYKTEITNRGIVNLDVCVKGAITEELRNFDFLLSLYIYADSDANEEAEMHYIQHSMLSGENNQISVGNQAFNTISINRALVGM